MVAITKVVGLLAGFASAVAVPEAFDIVPGPGLPSLQELGISRRAFKEKRDAVLAEFKAAREVPSSKEKRFDPSCYTDPAQLCVTADAASLVAYMRNLDKISCVITGESTEFAKSSNGTCRIIGHNKSDKPSVSSYCGDFATGLDYVIDHCQTGNNVAGINAANGNGEAASELIAVH